MANHSNDGALGANFLKKWERSMTNIYLPMPTAEETQAAFGNDFNPDKTLNGAIALAAAGDLARPALMLMRAVFACPAADARLREAMIVRTAVRLNCIYAVHASTRIALNSGLSKIEVDALTADGPVAGIDPDIVLIARMADDIADRANLREDLLETAIERWGVDNTRKLILMLSWFNLVNRYESACRVPMDSEEKLTQSSGPI
jgi:alkylhydroperoxidase family enzyme